MSSGNEEKLVTCWLGLGARAVHLSRVMGPLGGRQAAATATAGAAAAGSGDTGSWRRCGRGEEGGAGGGERAGSKVSLRVSAEHEESFKGRKRDPSPWCHACSVACRASSVEELGVCIPLALGSAVS